MNRSDPSDVDTVPKLCGGDTELANFITGCEGDSTVSAASALLRQFHGFSRRSYSGGSTYNPGHGEDHGSTGSARSTGGYQSNAQDWGRKFLPSTGACVYIDLSHLELCTPEVRSAFDYVAAFNGMLRLTRGALRRANAAMPPGRKIRVLANNSDGTNSWGGHLNFLISRRSYEQLFSRRMQYLLFLAACQVSSIVITGAGALGGVNRRENVPYRISSRSDFYEVLVGPQTTYNRPIVNSRDEALVGWPGGTASGCFSRLHVIFFDTNLCQVATLLKVGMMQVVLAMIEQEQVPMDLLLQDPLEALTLWSHDPELRATARLMDRGRCTAAEHQQRLFDAAKRFVDGGRADGLIPRANEIMDLWGDSVQKLRQRDLAAMCGRCDWLAKRLLLERAAKQHRLSWDSPRMKVLEHLYSSLDDDGLYWAYAGGGGAQAVVEDAMIDHFTHEPPDDTRAWLRAQVLRRAPEGLVDDVDWDRIVLRLPDTQWGSWISYRRATLEMDHPLRFNRDDCAPVLHEARTLLDALCELGLDGREPGSAGEPYTLSLETSRSDSQPQSSSTAIVRAVDASIPRITPIGERKDNHHAEADETTS